MKVLQLSTWQTQCGIADYTGSLRSELLRAGLDVDVWAIDRVANNYRSRQELDLSFRQFAADAADYDLVHIQHEFSFFSGAYGPKVSVDLFASLLRRLARGRVSTVVTFHTHPMALLDADSRRFRVAGALYLRAQLGRALRGSTAPALITHNRATRRALVDVGAQGDRVEVIPIGVPPLREADEAARIRAKRALGLPTTGTVLGMFGFLTESKGLPTALAAVELLPDDVHLLIVGGPHPHARTGPLDEMLRWLHEHPSVAPRVHLAGYVEDSDLDDYLAAVDVNLAPYAARPMLSSSAAITKAIASGRPVVASRIPAFIELNETAGECLWLSTPEAPFELAHRIEELLEDDDSRKRLIANCETYARTNSWPTVAERHISLYERARIAGGRR